MPKVTELQRPLRRQVEGLVAELRPAAGGRPAGVVLRGFRKHRGVFVPLEEIARLGLEAEGYALTAEQWRRPLRTLHELGGQTRPASSG